MEYQNWSRFVPAMAVALLLTTGPLIAAEESDEAASATGDSQSMDSESTNSESTNSESMDSESMDSESMDSESTAESAGTAADREAIDIVGRDVLDQENEEIGTVSNVLIGPSSGRVDAVVLSTGGLLGLGSTEYEIPWDRIAMSPDGQDVVVGVAKDDIETEFSVFEVDGSPEPEITEESEESEATEESEEPAATDEPESESETLE